MKESKSLLTFISKKSNGKSVYMCECGTVVEKRTYDVKVGKTKSCGCLLESRKIPDITGLTFNRLTAVENLGFNERRQRIYYFQCVCGNKLTALAKEVIGGKQKSCGCLIVDAVKLANTTHGKTNTNLYSRYRSMVKRCYSKTSGSYKNYGGRGIKICDDWLGTNGFVNFEKWAVSNGYNKGLSIDRINNDGDYSPENCRWTTPSVQSNNRRNSIYFKLDDVEKPLSEWADDFGIKYCTLWKRIFVHGYSFEDAIHK